MYIKGRKSYLDRSTVHSNRKDLKHLFIPTARNVVFIDRPAALPPSHREKTIKFEVRIGGQAFKAGAKYSGADYGRRRNIKSIVRLFIFTCLVQGPMLSGCPGYLKKAQISQ